MQNYSYSDYWIPSNNISIHSIKEDNLDLWNLHLPLKRSILTKLKSYLNSSEVEEAMSYQDIVLKEAFIASRGGLRKILSLYTGTLPQDISISYGRFKKPYLQNSNINFNVSHSGDHILYAIIISANIGVDIERLNPEFDFHDIVIDNFTINEREIIYKQPVKNQSLAFFRCWTRKEACVKAIGEGLYYNLNDIEVTCSSDIATVIKFKNHNRPWNLIEIIPAPNYIASISVDKKINKIRKIRLELDAS